ncbi:gliding motility protein GldN [Pseudoflavitalea sp. G-6-1-2]|uniref:type IX secretion system ring protein PorN/GldN n=1 Tax=Pseudoflavitalea sp. G-6-1-2 TaxID=2728841 RepID=UPI00146AD0EC|nr:gliding motility protein GldN [Pseudoflavitalea sp. G-6-1-2]NML19494.1 gliding motility protein GldN [Pseudoflavitalea sp. G-6-1-2]
MRNRLIKLGMLVALVAFVSTAVDAQTKPNRKKAVRKTTAKKTNSNRTNNSANNAAITPVVDTVPKAVAKVEADLKIEPPKKSLRNDNAIERNLVKERLPLAYEHIREDDAVYVQRVWRELDVHEKMNLPFVYKADGDLGNQRFIMILLNAIKNDSITAFSPIDDRFTTPMSFKEISEKFVGTPKVIQVPDLASDPDGSKGLMRDTTIVEEFDADKSVERYWIKEDVIFDKESSRLFTRILGIAPLKTIYNDDGSFRDVTPVFWVYYPDLRPTFAKYEVYNGRNFGGKVSWEELFESRMFSSRIIKSTINNPNDLFIKSFVKDPILALLEGENVKEKIFNYEQDLWSY